MTTSPLDPRVRYVTWGEYGPGVYESQVVRLVDLLAANVDIRLLALVRQGLIASLEPPRNGRLLAGPVTSSWPLRLYRLQSGALANELAGGSGILHCRGPLAALAALRSRPPGWKVIHDYRSLDAVEMEEERGGSRGTRRLARLEAEACRRADLVSVVSEPLGRIVLEDYGVPASRVVVHPTGVETSAFAWEPDARSAARDELGLGDGPVVVYVGSAAHWQLAEVCVRSAALLHDATLLVLSEEAGTFRALAADAGIPDGRLVARAASREEVARLVCAADAALLPRARSPINAVAAPVKYAEYLAAGVPVVTVAGTGPFADQVEREELGAVAAEASPEALAAAAELLLSSGDDLRARCRATAVREFDLEAIALRYVESYRTLAAAP
jgi:glycosyltransferase involved in cell wall biosynthesis